MIICVKHSVMKFPMILKDGALEFTRCSPAQNNRANAEVLKELKRLLKKSVRIVSGITSREKVLLIERIIDRGSMGKISLGYNRCDQGFNRNLYITLRNNYHAQGTG